MSYKVVNLIRGENQHTGRGQKKNIDLNPGVPPWQFSHKASKLAFLLASMIPGTVTTTAFVCKKRKKKS